MATRFFKRQYFSAHSLVIHVFHSIRTPHFSLFAVSFSVSHLCVLQRNEPLTQLLTNKNVHNCFYETSQFLWILFRKYFKYVRKSNALLFRFDHVQNNGHHQITDHNLPLCFVCVHTFCFFFFCAMCTQYSIKAS